jgi:hypothetical protein
MSAANMGISQLECLQLRSLVGPTGLGTLGVIGVGSPFGDVVVATVPMIVQPDGKTKSNPWISPFTVPSGTGLLYMTVQTRTTGGLPFYYQIGCGTIGSTILPSVTLYDAGVGLQGYAGFWAEGLMMYSNPSPDPAPIELIVGAAGTTTNFQIINFQARVISFGPNVSQA